MSTIRGKSELLLQKLLRFYSDPRYLNIFVKIVVEDDIISLRLFDYFSTNYTKKNIVYTKKGTHVDIYNNYKQNLKGFKKKYFDPFCRNTRLKLVIRDKSISTR